MKAAFGRNQPGSMFPSNHDLHTALWSSFLNPSDAARFPPERRPISLDSTLSTLLSLLNPENVEILRRVPRSLFGVATWNLLPQYLGTSGATKLEPLLRNVIGMTLDQVEAIYSRSTDPLLVLARQYNILDYRWGVTSKEDAKELEAELHICVQGELEAMKQIVFPDYWPRYEWLWGGVDLLARRKEPHWRKQEAGEEKCTGRVRLPGGPKETEAVVELDVIFHCTPLEVRNDFALKGEIFEHCGGSFSIKKMRGRPGATHVIHRKKAVFRPFVPQEIRPSILKYWLQSETLRLVLPD